jgi:hypothetical protein
VAGASTAATTTTAAGEGSGGFRRGAVAGAIGSSKNGKLNRVAFARALRAGNLLLLVEHNLLEVRLAILTNVFVDGHASYLSFRTIITGD